MLSLDTQNLKICKWNFENVYYNLCILIEIDYNLFIDIINIDSIFFFTLFCK